MIVAVRVNSHVHNKQTLHIKSYSNEIHMGPMHMRRSVDPLYARIETRHRCH